MRLSHKLKGFSRALGQIVKSQPKEKKFEDLSLYYAQLYLGSEQIDQMLKKKSERQR